MFKYWLSRTFDSSALQDRITYTRKWNYKTIYTFSSYKQTAALFKAQKRFLP